MTVSIPKVYITQSSFSQMLNHAKKRANKETGGLLLGSVYQTKQGHKIVIHKVTGPGKASQHNELYFKPDIHYYKSVLKRNSHYRYLGEWHSHPPAVTEWSEYDLQQAQKILWEEQKFELLCPILVKQRDGEYLLVLYYINQRLSTFVEIPYTVVPDLKSEVFYKFAFIEDVVIEDFVSQKEQHKIISIDVYPEEKTVHIFQKPLQGNSRALLLKNSPLEIDIPYDVQAIVVVNEKENSAAVYAMGQQSQKLHTQMISLEKGIFLRNSTLLETSLLRKSHVAIIGLGSLGSQIALELTRAGVGSFTLIDKDKINIENLCRHVCDLTDLGIPKSKAIAKRIHRILPTTKVSYHHIDSNKNPDQTLHLCRHADLIVAATDTENSRSLCNWIAHELNIPVIFAGLLDRAIGGRVWRILPKKSACYDCYKNWNIQQSPNQIPYSIQTLENANIQPGLGNDIGFIAHLATRYVIDSLKQPDADHLEEIPYNLVFWFNRHHPDWKTQALNIYHIKDLPKKTNCETCTLFAPV